MYWIPVPQPTEGVRCSKTNSLLISKLLVISVFIKPKAMIGEKNRQLGTHEPVEFQKSPAEVQDDCRKITHHFRGIYRILPQFNKGKIGDCQLVAAWTCKHWYLKPVIMPKTSPITAPKCLGGCFWYSFTHLGSASQHVSRGLEFCLLMGFLVIHPNLSLLNHFRFAIQV